MNIGIQSLETIKELLWAGDDEISLNPFAVKNPDCVSRASDRFLEIAK